MKRFLSLALVFILVMSFPSAASAEPAQVGYGILEEAASGACVRVIVDLADNWSAGFYPMAFYLYDQPATSNSDAFLAFGTLLDEKSYESVLEVHADEERTDQEGTIIFKSSEGETCFVAPVSEGLYLMLLVEPGPDAEAVWTRVAFVLEDYNFADPLQTASGVITDNMDSSVQVRVTLDLKYGWSALFLPGSFLLYNEDTPEGDYDVYGTLLSEEEYAAILEIHNEDKSLEEKDGYVSYTTDSYTGFLAPVDEHEYITLIVYGHYDPEAMWERLSYELF